MRPTDDSGLPRPSPQLDPDEKGKLLRAYLDCRVSVRKARHDAIDMLGEFKKEGSASEDEVERAKKRVEEVVGAAGQAIDGVVQSKEKEILAL